MLAHITMLSRSTLTGVFAGLVKAGFSFDRYADRDPRAFAESMTDAELVALLRENIRHPWRPPGGGEVGALSHDVIHGLDINHPGTFDYIHAYAATRSRLGALADLSEFDEFCRFERSLIDLDGIHAAGFPATYPMYGARAELLAQLEVAVDRMIQLGGDALSLELLLADLLGPITDP